VTLTASVLATTLPVLASVVVPEVGTVKEAVAFARAIKALAISYPL
jgi:hypothetical protein